MKTVVLDIDGVLAEFTLGFKSFINRFTPYRIAPTGAQKDWHYAGMTQAQSDTVWAAVRDGDFDWDKLPSLLTEGDRYAIQQLRLLGYIDFQYVTNRVGPRAKAQSEAWLDREGLPKGAVTVAKDKVAVVQKFPNEVAAIIDDSPANLKAFLDAGFEDVTYVRDWQYNRSFPVRAERRVSSVAEFAYRVIEDLTGIDNETGKRVEEGRTVVQESC